MRISKEAIEEIKLFIQSYAEEIAKISIEISKAARRKTIKKEDVLLAIT